MPLGVTSVYVSVAASVVTATYSISPDVDFVKLNSCVEVPRATSIAALVCVNVNAEDCVASFTSLIFVVV